MKIDLFSHFSTREFREAYFSIPLGGKGRRLDPLAIRTFAKRIERLCGVRLVDHLKAGLEAR